MSQQAETYETYVRPWLGGLLRSLRLDVSYTRAEGNWLSCGDGSGPARVLDAVGGYGANFFGHYHPALTDRLVRLVAGRVPVQAQGSIRSVTADLARELSRRVGGGVDEYVVTFASTGAEAVEAAVKHAELAWREGVAEHRQRLVKKSAQLVRQLPELDDAALRVLRQLGYTGDRRTRAALDHLIALNDRAAAGSPQFLALEGAFHGKTMGAVQLTHHDTYRGPFDQGSTRFVSGPAALAEQLRACRRTRYEVTVSGSALVITSRSFSAAAAFFVEPIQGEGGIRVLTPRRLRELAAAARAEGVPLVLDEIQSGMGRTGSFCFSEQSGVRGDYVLLAKSLGGGLVKIGALLVRRERYRHRFGEIHSSTFAEDDLSAGVALEALRVLDSEGLMTRAAATGRWLREQLEQLRRRYPGVLAEIRGAGLMIGVEFAGQSASPSRAIRLLDAQRLLGYALTGYLLHEHGVRVAPTLSNPNTLRLEPAATLSLEEGALLLRALESACEVIHKANAYRLTRFIVGATGGSRVADYRRDLGWDAHDPSLPQVAFVGHFITTSDMALWDPSFELFTSAELVDYLERVGPYLKAELTDRRTVVSGTGAKVQLNFLGVLASSRQMSRSIFGDGTRTRAMISEAVQESAAAGCVALGLGGYNSIVTANAQSLPPDHLALTTGNALTVGMGLRAVERAAAERGIPLESARFAAVGANGNIASIYSELMSDRVPSLLLIGRPGREEAIFKAARRVYARALKRIDAARAADRTAGLRGLAGSIFRHPSFQALADRTWPGTEDDIRRLHDALTAGPGEAPLSIATDLGGLARANLVLAASNSPDPLIFAGMLGPQPVVICDISVPMDTDASVRARRPDVTVIQGGVVRLPANPDFVIGGIPLEPGLSFACMAETVLLGLEGIRTHYSYGQISADQVETISAVAEKHGFVLGRPRLESSY
ncbi:aminotransferase class III-fold pyridoxal phosphate-dependent enzyme [Actinoplanes sp. ATCC 53533]|uniref:aminotransferase class III-fold pyridoxal phosphate-dependent enzyme n=1 Tax=Actinoplanes sp. ATCC 53533 TaxID=1288362 RepID=UPI00131542BF|nr:aminotransferase class III-fold pyridoxal phosphate-dependent enzyme [Actinoplanes sp. ATCC 53533]